MSLDLEDRRFVDTGFKSLGLGFRVLSLDLEDRRFGDTGYKTLGPGNRVSNFKSRMAKIGGNTCRTCDSAFLAGLRFGI